MKNNRKTILGVLAVVIISCIAMYVVEVFIKPGYLVKSICKLALFGGLPLVYCAFDRSIGLRDFFKIGSKKQLQLSLLLGASVYGLIIGGYFLLKSFIDLINISTLLTQNLNISKDNFIFIAIYISFVNSLLEEFFFRGFAFLSLNKVWSRVFAYSFSALAFAIYHIAILTSWFSIVLFIAVIAELFISGVFFNWLNEKNGNIYNSWLVHMCANFAINTVGFIMFGII